jgi:putative acetyltransferase
MSLSAPPEWTKKVTLGDGTKVILRPEVASDLEMVWEMQSTLSQESLRFLPSGFTREMVEGWFKNIDYEAVLPVVAIVDEPQGERIIGSATLMFSKNPVFRHRAEFGINIHDDYQNRGLGTLLTKHMIGIARAKGIRKVTLMVVTDNERAIRVYRNCGFEVEGRLRLEHLHTLTGEYGDDYRMAVTL